METFRIYLKNVTRAVDKSGDQFVDEQAPPPDILCRGIRIRPDRTQPPRTGAGEFPGAHICSIARSAQMCSSCSRAVCSISSNASAIIGWGQVS